MEQREFLKIIRRCRRRMRIADFLKKSASALSIGAGAGILFQAAAFFMPLYYAGLYVILALLLAEVSVFVVMFVKQTTMEQAALMIDSFGFEERIVTAYEHLGKEGALIGLQRKDAMEQLKEHKGRIQIPLLPSFKRNALLFLLLVFLAGISLLPSAAKDRAGELHSLKEEAREKEDEIEEIMEALEQLEQEKLTKEQQEALHEMMESLESSLSEYQEALSEEALAVASQKLDYKYENMSNQLSEIIQDLQNGAGVPVAAMDSLQEMADKLKEMNETELAQGGGSDIGQEGTEGDSLQGQESGAGNGSGQSEQGRDGNGNGRGNGSSSTPHDYVSVPNAVADSGNLMGNVENHDNSQYFRAQNGLNWKGIHTSYEAVIGSYEQNAYEGIAAGRYPSGMEEIIKEYFASFND